LNVNTVIRKFWNINNIFEAEGKREILSHPTIGIHVPLTAL